MVKSVVSLTFLGTSHHRDTHPSAILESFENIQRYAKSPDSVVVARLFDGPGCKGSVQHPRPGTYMYEDKTKKLASKAVISQWLNRAHQLGKRIYSAIVGAGVEELLLEATLFLEEVIQENSGELPKVINLQGFSRGADNCVRFANIINRLHPSIEVNICVIDPVPGPFRRAHPDSFIIPSNVKAFDATLMLNEYRRVYKPQHSGRYIFQNTETRVSIHHVAGMHGSGLSTENENKLTPYSTQLLTQDNLLKFNIEHGSLPPTSVIGYRHQRSGEHYESIKLKKPIQSLCPQDRFQVLCKSMDKYKDLFDRDAKQYIRTIVREREGTLLDHDLFIDQEHRELFKQIFPATFNWFFEKNYTPVGKSPYTRSQVFEELTTLKSTRYGRFYEAFLNKFAIPNPTSEKEVMPPQGRLQDERPAFNRALVTDELSYLRYSLSNIVNYYFYHHPDHDALSDTQRREIKKILTQTLREEDSTALFKLKNLITQIKQKAGNGFIHGQVSKIIHDPEKYAEYVINLLTTCRNNLLEDVRLMDQALADIQSIVEDSSQDNYQKRLQIQTYLTAVYAQFLKSHESDADTLSTAAVRFSQDLYSLTIPSYAETTNIDKIIYDLECYVYWRSFLPCYFSSYFFNQDNIHLAEKTITQLKAVKEPKGNILQVQQILEDASAGFVNSGPSGELSWMKQLKFKSDYLNKIILKHLAKAISITSIFSHPLQDDFKNSAPKYP